MTEELKHPYREEQKPSERPVTKEMSLESLLTVSAETYCKTNGRELNDYLMVGVHGSCYRSNLDTHLIKVPFLTEIVVDAQIVGTREYNVSYITYFGTALIPRKAL